jgi:hypothetical protein
MAPSGNPWDSGNLSWRVDTSNLPSSGHLLGKKLEKWGAVWCYDTIVICLRKTNATRRQPSPCPLNCLHIHTDTAVFFQWDLLMFTDNPTWCFLTNWVWLWILKGATCCWWHVTSGFRHASSVAGVGGKIEEATLWHLSHEPLISFWRQCDAIQCCCTTSFTHCQSDWGS